MKFSKDMLLLYAVTDRSWVGRQSLYEQIGDALRGGVTLVQLREKNLDTVSLVKEAIEIGRLCRSYGVPLIINDNAEAALRSGAAGVHVGAADTPVEEIRKTAGKDFIIGATAKTVEQARAAEAAGADYIGVGAVFPSPTKKNAARITCGQLRDICSSVSIPAVAIGGITCGNIAQLRGGGVCGIAAVSAIFSAGNIQAETERLRKKVMEVVIHDKGSNI